MKKILLIVCIAISTLFANDGMICGTENLNLEIDDGGIVWLQLVNPPNLAVSGNLTKENWKYYLASDKKSSLALILQAMNNNACIYLKFVDAGNNQFRITNVSYRNGW